MHADNFGELCDVLCKFDAEGAKRAPVHVDGGIISTQYPDRPIVVRSG